MLGRFCPSSACEENIVLPSRQCQNTVRFSILITGESTHFRVVETPLMATHGANFVASFQQHSIECSYENQDGEEEKQNKDKQTGSQRSAGWKKHCPR